MTQAIHAGITNFLIFALFSGFAVAMIAIAIPGKPKITEIFVWKNRMDSCKEVILLAFANSAKAIGCAPAYTCPAISATPPNSV